jgi:hypothetical protein
MRNILVRCLLVAMCVVAWHSAVSTQPQDFRTFFTFTAPVAIPGATLPPGKYLFRLADPGIGSRNTVQILSADGKKSYAMFFFHRRDRAASSPDPVVNFLETAAGMPQAVRGWWYAGERSGYEFVYPKEQALLLAKGSGTPVITAPKTALAAATPPISTVSPTGEEKAVVEGEAAPAGPTLAGQIAPPSIVIAEPALQARAELPRTASHMPALLLLMVGLLFSAALLRAWRLG